MRKLTNILAIFFSMYELTTSGTLATNSPIRNNLTNTIEQKNLKFSTKRFIDYLIPETQEQGVILNPKIGKIAYISKNENSSLFLESMLTKTGNYIKMNYSSRNLRFDFSTEMSFIDITKMAMNRTSPFFKPQMTINLRFSFPVPLGF